MRGALEAELLILFPFSAVAYVDQNAKRARFPPPPPPPPPGMKPPSQILLVHVDAFGGDDDDEVDVPWKSAPSWEKPPPGE